MAREFARRLYSSQRWQATRQAYLESVNHLCENCLRQGIYKPAEIVHHKETVQPWNINNPEITLNWSNLEALCRECHASEHEDIYKQQHFDRKFSKKRYKVEEDGTIVLK